MLIKCVAMLVILTTGKFYEGVEMMVLVLVLVLVLDGVGKFVSKRKRSYQLPEDRRSVGWRWTSSRNNPTRPDKIFFGEKPNQYLTISVSPNNIDIFSGLAQCSTRQTRHHGLFRGFVTFYDWHPTINFTVQVWREQYTIINNWKRVLARISSKWRYRMRVGNGDRRNSFIEQHHSY